jgi:flagellar protein FliL
MPEEKEAAQETEKQTASEQNAAGGDSMTHTIIKVSVVVAVVVIAVLAGFMVTAKVLKPMMAHDPNAVAEEVATVSEEDHGGGEEQGEEGKPGEESMYEISQIIVNPASTVGSRFLSCSVAFELSKPSDMQIFESREIKLRDAMIALLSARTVDELADAHSRESLRTQILDRVNKLAEPAKAKAVYFKDFVLQ